MAFSLDATSQVDGLAGTTVTWSHTIGAGSNRLLVVLISGRSSANVSGVTFDGVALTQVGSTRDDSSTDTSIWYLTAPNTGAHNIVITKASGQDCDAGGISYIDALIDVASFTNNSGMSTTPSITVTPNHADGHILGVLGLNDSGTLTYTGPGTEFFSQGFDPRYRGAYGAFTGGASITHSWTSSNNRAWTVAGVEVYPAGTNYSLPLSETITLVDIISRQTGKKFIEAVTLVDIVVRTIGRRLIEVVTIVDLLRRVPQRRLIEAITIVDVITTARVRVANLSEIITIVDFCRRTLNRTLTEAITIVDTCARISGRSITFLETLLLSDILVKGLTRAIGLLETIAVLDIAVNFFKRTSGIMRGIAKKTGTILGTHKKE